MSVQQVIWAYNKNCIQDVNSRSEQLIIEASCVSAEEQQKYFSFSSFSRTFWDFGHLHW